MKSYIQIITLAFFFHVILCAQVQAQSAFDEYKLNGIVVSQDSDMAPMSFVGEDGLPKGFIIDLWKKWSAETGIPVSFHLVDWAESLVAVKDGKADVHGGLFYTEARDVFLDYTTPFFPSTGGVYIKKGRGIREIAQLDGRDVGVIESSFFDNYMKLHYPNMVPIRFKTTQELAENAIRGDIAAFVGDYPTIMFQIGGMGKVDEFEVLDFSGTQYFRAAVAEGNEKLLKVIEQGLELVDQSERDSIFQRWVIGQPKEASSWMIPTILVSVGILILAACIPFVVGRVKRKRD